MSTLPRVCVIGAGSSGITTVKALRDAGVPFDCFEKSDRIGGNWVFGNRNGMSAAYRSLHINTSKRRMEYADLPMPDAYPDFPHHTQVAAYFEHYAEAFDLKPHIQFNRSVERADLDRHDATWTVTLDDGSSQRYDAVVVANGHHWDPRWPDPAPPGRFAGDQMHAHDYRDSEPLKGRRVVVVGMGNSAMDIAVESSRVAERTFLVARRGVHILPKYLFGTPFDLLPQHPLFPFKARQATLKALLAVAVGPPERYGLPRPDHEVLEAHPTVSAEIHDRLGHGDITVKPAIERFEGDHVRFADGTAERADLVVWCTGYKVSFPFFDSALISAPGNDLPLFKRVFHPEIATVFFIGLAQPLGAVMPVAEKQSKWVAAHLVGGYLPPARPEMRKDIARERARLRRRFVASPRHTMEVDFDDYLHEVDVEWARGEERARRAGYPLPIPGETGGASRPLGASASAEASA